MGNTMTLEFAGDAAKLQKASKQSQGALDDVEKAAKDAGKSFDDSGKSSGAFLDKIGKLGAGISGITDAFDNATGAMQALADIQNADKEKAARQARALADVEQAMLDGEQAAQDLTQAQNDLNQAFTDAGQASLDAEQAEIDKTQATLDAKTAQEDYNKAVKEHGKNSAEALQAAIDLRQAQADATQADLDGEQAKNDLAQADSDYEQASLDAAQAVRDGKDAQLDLNDAQREANPPDIQKWANAAATYAPILTGIVSVTGLVTAAQWAWNAAQAASPTTWIVLGILVLIGVIALIVTHLDVVKKAWNATWGWIKDVASSVGRWFRDTLWGKWIKGAWDGIVNQGVKVVVWFQKMQDQVKGIFAKIGNAIFAPFRWAFNKVADAWNNTIGRLHFSIPGIPGLFGGYTIDVPDLPHFHSGGVVPGAPGSEMLAVLQAGETVIPASGGSGGGVHVTVMLDSGVLVEGMAREVGRRGGNVQLVLSGANG